MSALMLMADALAKDPVPDWWYVATLEEPGIFPLYERRRKRLNYWAGVVAPIGNPPPGVREGLAVGHLYTSRNDKTKKPDALLTPFLDRFGLYEKRMSTAKRV